MPQVPGLGTMTETELDNYEARLLDDEQRRLHFWRFRELPEARPEPGTPEWHRILRAEQAFVDLANAVYSTAWQVEHEGSAEWRAKYLQELRDLTRKSFERFGPMIDHEGYPIRYHEGVIPYISEDRDGAV